MTGPDAPDPARPLGWRTFAWLVPLYAAAVAVATYPAVTTFRTHLPARLSDPLAHLWTLRWYRTCLTEGRSPFLCPEVQYPVGAPLGYLPPMQLQALLYLPLSTVLGNDVLIYNLIWSSSFLFTGVGTFLLAWHVVRDRRGAAFAGLAAMLSGPMTFFAHGQVEQITLGWLPIFLLAWLRGVDRPSPGRWAAAVASYALLAMSAPYFAVFAIIPATLYVLHRLVASRGAIGDWLRPRWRWLGGFGVAAFLIAAALFSSQVWAMAHGFPMRRSEAQFAQYGASLWGYVVPSLPHVLTSVLPSFYLADGILGKFPSYLGVIPVGLLAYAALVRPRFARAGFWWASVAALVILSLGAYGSIGSHRVPLPALWLRRFVPLFAPMRVPARFNLFAGACAAVIAGAALRDVLARIKAPRWRSAAFGAIVVLTVVDLAHVPFQTEALPPIPACYGAILGPDPEATILDAPLANTCNRLPALCTYWQGLHRGRTSAGYTASTNTRQDNLLAINSPFFAVRLMDPAYPAVEGESFDLVRNVGFLDYTWLYLTAHGFDYVVLHHAPGSYPEAAMHLERTEALLAPARVLRDEEASVFARDRLAAPGRPVIVTTEGWRDRIVRRGGVDAIVAPRARLIAYNPTPDAPLSLTLVAEAYRAPRVVRLLRGGDELARWAIAPGSRQAVTTPAIRLPAGLSGLELVSDGASPPDKPGHAPIEGDMTPFSLWASAVHLGPAPAIARADPGATRR